MNNREQEDKNRKDISSQMYELVVYLKSRPEDIDKLIISLNDVASDYDSYEYGLPLHGDILFKMRTTILEWLKDL